VETAAWILLGFVVTLLLTLGLIAIQPKLGWRPTMALGYLLAVCAILVLLFVLSGWTTRSGWLAGCIFGWLFGALWADDLMRKLRRSLRSRR
jgi:hypothetical protein